MNKLYEKNELTFALVCIAAYCALQSAANPLNRLLGVDYAASALLGIAQAAALFLFLKTIQIRILGNTGFIGIIVSHPLVINIGILRFFSRIRGTVRRCYGGHPNRQTGSTLSYWRQRAR